MTCGKQHNTSHDFLHTQCASCGQLCKLKFLPTNSCSERFYCQMWEQIYNIRELLQTYEKTKTSKHAINEKNGIKRLIYTSVQNQTGLENTAQGHMTETEQVVGSVLGLLFISLTVEGKKLVRSFLSVGSRSKSLCTWWEASAVIQPACLSVLEVVVFCQQILPYELNDLCNFSRLARISWLLNALPAQLKNFSGQQCLDRFMVVPYSFYIFLYFDELKNALWRNSNCFST